MEKLSLLVTIIVFPIIVQKVSVFYEPNKYTCHAEKDAIKKVRNKYILKDCKVYIGRIKNNKLEPATPCEMCKKLLKKYGVKKINLI